MHYAEIHIEGRLDEHWEEWLGDVSIQYTEMDDTILTGYFPDQAALYGLIAKLRDLGVKLISVNFQEAPC
jgi:hypothetical protein